MEPLEWWTISRGGQIVATLYVTEAEARANAKDGEVYHKGRFCPDTHFIGNDGNFTLIAPRPNAWVTFDQSTKRWAPDAVALRAERARLLAACDWTQMPDVPLSVAQKQAWAAYRQALRDFPETCGPDNPVWPEPPR